MEGVTLGDEGNMHESRCALLNEVIGGGGYCVVVKNEMEGRDLVRGGREAADVPGGAGACGFMTR